MEIFSCSCNTSKCKPKKQGTPLDMLYHEDHSTPDWTDVHDDNGTQANYHDDGPQEE